MKKFLLVCLLGSFAMAGNMHFEKNKKCSECHPAIYEEYMQSQHAKATVFDDEIHAAVYYKHPQYNKMDKYRCGACHTPTADNLDALLAKNNGVVPDAHNETQNEAVACAYCHRIEDTKPGKAFNKNIISKEERVYFSNKSNPKSSPFHGVKTNKEVFKDGKMCLGCHAHKSNKKGFDVCETDINQKAPKKNCIECHMHQVDGAPSIMSDAKKHTFHGFPGLHGDLTHLSQYIGMDISTQDDNKMFTVIVDHQAPHSSVLHPLRMGKLEVTVKRGSDVIKMQDRKLIKIIGSKEGVSPSPTPPWLATQIIKDTRIPANTSKAYPYKWDLQSGDVITAKFGYYLVKPGAVKKFDLQDNKEATKFRVIKEQSFTVK
jgi:nitrate reductase cytochrome c-type subunit